MGNCFNCLRKKKYEIDRENYKIYYENYPEDLTNYIIYSKIPNQHLQPCT